MSETSAEDFQPESLPRPDDADAVEDAAEQERLRARADRPDPVDADEREEPSLLDGPDDEPGTL